MKPRISILSKAFEYKNAARTNVAETIQKERDRLAAEKKEKRTHVLIMRKRA